MKRFVLNISLLVLLLLSMGFHFLPQLVHEVLGLVLLAGACWHLVLNRRWFVSLLHGGWHRLRLVQSLLGLGLVVAFLLAVGTGIIISNHVFRELWVGVPLHRSIFVHQLHIASSYAMVILCGMHMGMHWYSLWRKIKQLPPLGLLAEKPALRFWVLAGMVWVGCALARLDHVGDRLLMQHIFGTLATQLPLGIYHLMLLAMMGIYAIGFFQLQRHWQKKLLQGRAGTDRGGAQE